jgi:hypothetical protein
MRNEVNKDLATATNTTAEVVDEMERADVALTRPGVDRHAIDLTPGSRQD